MVWRLFRCTNLKKGFCIELYFFKNSMDPPLSQVMSAMTNSRLRPVLRSSNNSLFVTSLGNLCSQYMQFTKESNKDVNLLTYQTTHKRRFETTRGTLWFLFICSTFRKNMRPETNVLKEKSENSERKADAFCWNVSYQWQKHEGRWSLRKWTSTPLDVRSSDAENIWEQKSKDLSNTKFRCQKWNLLPELKHLPLNLQYYFLWSTKEYTYIGMRTKSRGKPYQKNQN